MTTCTHLSDRMPDVAAGRTTWAAAEAAHLLGCADCAAEWRLVGAAAGLGHGVAGRVDPSRVAAAVAERLRNPGVEPVEASPRWRRVFIPLAVAASLVLGIWLGRPPLETTPAPVATVAVLPELDGLTDAELESLFTVLAGSDTDPLPPLEATEPLGDLDDSELETLLQMMEGS